MRRIQFSLFPSGLFSRRSGVNVLFKRKRVLARVKPLSCRLPGLPLPLSDKSLAVVLAIRQSVNGVNMALRRGRVDQEYCDVKIASVSEPQNDLRVEQRRRGAGGTGS